MSNVVSLGGTAAAAALEPHKDVIEALEKLLEEAKNGRIQHLVAVFSDGASSPTDVYVGTGEVPHVMQIIGGMELCKQTMLMSLFHETTDYHRAG